MTTSILGRGRLPKKEVAGEVQGRTSTSLRNRFGVTRGRQLITSADWRERMRGVERLATAGDARAIAALVEGMDAGALLREHLHTRLAGVRALAPHAGQDDVREVLIAIVNSAGAGPSEVPLARLARQTAAMALAAAGQTPPLLTGVLAKGKAMEVARDALLAYPPRDLQRYLSKRKRLSPGLLELLGDLGDLRLIAILRGQLDRKRMSEKRAAAVALAKLGDGRAAEVAMAWLQRPQIDDGTLTAAAEILARLAMPQASGALKRMITSEKTRKRGLILAARFPTAQLLAPLVRVMKESTRLEERLQAVMVIGRIGGARVVPILEAEAADGALDEAAMFALARVSGGSAGRSLARLLARGRGASRRQALRACLVRYLAQADRVEGLLLALNRSLASPDASDRAVASFGLALLREEARAALLKDEREEVSIAAARAMLAAGPRAMATLRPMLAKAAQVSDLSHAQIAVVAALLVVPEVVATRQLVRWVETGGAIAPVAAFALAMRDSRSFRPRLERLMAGSDPGVRSHLLWGLGYSPESDAVSLLVQAYRQETEPRVRRAVIRGLSLRDEPHRTATLLMARAFDPDSAVRALARSALEGRRHRWQMSPRGQEVVWLRASKFSEGNPVGPLVGQVVRSDGLALPVVSDPDGVFLIPGMALSGEVSLLLATGSDSEQPSP